MSKIKLKYYNETDKSVVGNYDPSDDWSDYLHYAVMNDKTLGMLASVGYYLHRSKPEKFDFEEYDNAARCIGQAQLYAHAVPMFEMLAEAEQHLTTCPDIKDRIRELLGKINDISEPATRLLGKDAMKVINRKK